MATIPIDADKLSELLIELTRAKDALKGAGYTVNNGINGPVWVPPVNTQATELWQLKAELRRLIGD